MEIIKDKWIATKARYCKVKYHNKHFRRFHYVSMGRSVDVLWLASDRSFLPETLEKVLESEFQKKVG
jgi:hypothetical protein